VIKGRVSKVNKTVIHISLSLVANSKRAAVIKVVDGGRTESRNNPNPNASTFWYIIIIRSLILYIRAVSYLDLSW